MRHLAAWHAAGGCIHQLSPQAGGCTGGAVVTTLRPGSPITQNTVLWTCTHRRHTRAHVREARTSAGIERWGSRCDDLSHLGHRGWTLRLDGIGLRHAVMEWRTIRGVKLAALLRRTRACSAAAVAQLPEQAPHAAQEVKVQSTRQSAEQSTLSCEQHSTAEGPCALWRFVRTRSAYLQLGADLTSTLLRRMHQA